MISLWIQKKPGYFSTPSGLVNDVRLGQRHGLQSTTLTSFFIKYSLKNNIRVN
jgi:hypothetical protein